MGRRRLKADAPRMLGRHDGTDGRSYRRAWAALTADFGTPGAFTLLRLEMGRVAAGWARYEAAQRVWADARRDSEAPPRKGVRRPSVAEINRLAKRVALEEGSYTAGLDRLRDLAIERKGRIPSPAEVQAALRGGA
jgi:hypothetical protein